MVNCRKQQKPWNPNNVFPVYSYNVHLLILNMQRNKTRQGGDTVNNK